MRLPIKAVLRLLASVANKLPWPGGKDEVLVSHDGSLDVPCEYIKVTDTIIIVKVTKGMV